MENLLVLVCLGFFFLLIFLSVNLVDKGRLRDVLYFEMCNS